MAPSERWTLLGSLLLTAAIFAPALSYELVYDDADQIVANQDIHHLERIGHSFTQHVWAFDPNHRASPTKYYRPLFLVALTLGYQVFGGSTFGFHAVCIALHLFCAALLHRFARVLGIAPRARLAAVAIYLLHPLQIQAVAWVSAISDPMLVACSLSCLLAWRRWLDTREHRFLLLALVLYACAMLTVERGIALAAPLLLLGFYQAELGSQHVTATTSFTRRVRGVVLQALLLALPIVPVLAARRAVLGASVTVRPGFLWDTVLTAPSVAQRYLQNLVLPLDLALAYPERFVAHLSGSEVLVPALVVAVTVVLLGILSRGDVRRKFLFGSLLCTLAPALCVGLLPGYALVQDRYCYLPLAFFALWLCDRVFDEGNARLLGPTRATQLALCLWLLVLLALHSRNLEPWHDDASLFARAVEVAPDNPQFVVNLAVVRRARGMMAPDCADLERAVGSLREHPTWGEPALAELSLGDCLREHGRPDQAVRAYDHSWKLSRGGLLDAGLHRVVAFSELGRLDEAVRAADELTKFHPESAAAWKVLGVAAARRGRFELAEQALSRSLALDPNDRSTQQALARVRLAQPH